MIPLRNRVAQFDRIAARAAQIANRRHARYERAARVRRGNQRLRDRRRQQHHPDIGFAAELQVHVRIDEARRHRRGFERALGLRGFAGGGDPLDAPALDDQGDIRPGRVAGAVIQPAAAHGKARGRVHAAAFYVPFGEPAYGR